MKTKRGRPSTRDAKTSETVKNETEKDVKNENSANSAAGSENGAAKPRVTIGYNLTDSGKIDFGGMREATRVRIRELISDPEVARAVGAEGPANVGSSEPMISPEACERIYSSVAKLEAMLLAKKFRVSKEFALEHLEFDEKELAQLTPPTSRILSKHVPGWLARFEDEISLAFLIFTISTSKISVLKEAAKLQHTPRAVPSRTEPQVQEAQENRGEIESVDITKHD
jgi:hypothetical protein